MVFVKAPPRSVVNRLFKELPGLTRAEERFYAELSEAVPVRVPASRVLRRRRLELELIPASALRPPSAWCSRVEAEAVLDALADLHRTWWDDPRLDGWLAEQQPREQRLGRALAPRLIRRGLARAGSLVPDELHAPTLAYAAERERHAATMHARPHTLVHNDCHLGNLWFDCEGRPGFFDWQLVRSGPWARDVAYFLATALRPQDRRRWQDELVGRYLTRLDRADDVGPDPWLDIRRHTTYAFEAMVVTLALGRMMPDHTARVLVARTAGAVDDLDGFDALEEAR